MSFIEIVQLIEELFALIQEMKADGSMQEIMQAAAAAKAVLEKPHAQAIIEKLKGLKING